MFRGARFTYWIGRPNDLISVLSGDDVYDGTDMILLNFHGDEGSLIMPELGEEVYEEEEPKGDFGADEIRRYAKLDGKTVIANGCSLGTQHWLKLSWSGAARCISGRMTIRTATMR